MHRSLAENGSWQSGTTLSDMRPSGLAHRWMRQAGSVSQHCILDMHILLKVWYVTVAYTSAVLISISARACLHCQLNNDAFSDRYIVSIFKSHYTFFFFGGGGGGGGGWFLVNWFRDLLLWKESHSLFLVLIEVVISQPDCPEFWF